jgi:hypothetical protein
MGVGLGAGDGVIAPVTEAVICAGKWVGIGVGLEAGNGVVASVTEVVIFAGKVDVGVTFAHATKLTHPKRNVTHL